MAQVSLQFAAEEELIRAAERVAARNHTDLSAMFRRYLIALASSGEPIDESLLPPITRSALGLMTGASDKPYKELLSDALAEKYGLT
jgi:Family of unknown function (DUF6364)